MTLPIVEDVEGTYQGYPIKSCSYRRTEGLNPDFGIVEIDYSSLVGLQLDYKDIPFRPSSPKPLPIPISIQGWYDTVGKQTIPDNVPAQPEAKPPKGKLGLFGDLVLKCKIGGSNRLVRYTDIYLDWSGIEEALDDLARVKEHKHGTLRVPVTDIRKFGPEYGAAVQRINCRLPNGEPDPWTLRDGEFHWEAQHVIRWLFKHLAGGPDVVGKSELFGLKLPIPSGIIVTPNAGEVLGRLTKILADYRLVAKLTRGNNYLVNRKGSTRLKAGQISESVGNARNIGPGDHLSYQRRTVTFTNRAWAVQVFGRPLIRRLTLLYTPIFQDPSSKRYYRLVDVGRVWQGFSFAKVQKQTLVGHEKSFRNVPPVITPGIAPAPGGAVGAAAQAATGGGVPVASKAEDFRLHVARRKAMQKCAFKMYAPESLFSEDRVDEKGVEYFQDKDLLRVSFLPVQDFGLWPSEKAKIDREIPRDNGEPDQEDIMLVVAPVVTARTIGQGLFRNVDDLEEAYKGLTFGYEFDARVAISLEEHYKKLIKDTGKEVERMNEALERNKPTVLQKIGQEFVAFVDDTAGAAARLLNKDADYLAKVEGTVLDAKSMKNFQKVMEKRKKSVEKWLQHYRKQRIEALKKKSTAAEGLRKVQSRIDGYRKVLRGVGGLPMKMNLPTAVMPDGSYKLQRETGILMFANPACHMEEPFLFDGDSSVGATLDGGVHVTFGYEVRENTTADITNVVLVSGKDDKISVAGINRSTVAPAKPVQAPEMRMYLMDNATPMNLAACIAQATKGAGWLMGPRVVIGHIYEFSGFLPIELDGGTSMVQYVWKKGETKEETKAARTYVYINAPKGKGPLGSAALALGAHISPIAAAQALDLMASERGDQ